MEGHPLQRAARCTRSTCLVKQTCLRKRALLVDQGKGIDRGFARSMRASTSPNTRSAEVWPLCTARAMREALQRQRGSEQLSTGTLNPA